jgi:hypothetical protein
LQNRGLMYRFFGKWMKAITKEWQMYPVGVVFGMGFETATEVALLATTALLATQSLPWYCIMCLPILFTAGMTMMDTLDGCFMNGAYGWAFFNPVRKVYYNLAITGLSVAICFFIGTIEVLGLLPMELHIHGSFWDFMENFNINTVHPHLGQRHLHLEDRPRRGEVERTPPGRRRRRVAVTLVTGQSRPRWPEGPGHRGERSHRRVASTAGVRGCRRGAGSRPHAGALMVATGRPSANGRGLSRGRE